MRRAPWIVVLLALTGCIDPDEPTQSYFRTPAPSTLPPINPASTEMAARVDTTGRRILAANPQVGAKPLFRTIGAPEPEVFHRGSSDIFVTEGLVARCDEQQLAAVLCLELGKMVREREAATPNSVRTPDTLPPIEPRFGQDDQFGGTADRSDMYALVQYDKERKLRRGPPKLPEPQLLASDYLAKAGFQPTALAAAAPVIEAAAAQATLEKQITNPASIPSPPAR